MVTNDEQSQMKQQQKYATKAQYYCKQSHNLDKEKMEHEQLK